MEYKIESVILRREKLEISVSSKKPEFRRTFNIEPTATWRTELEKRLDKEFGDLEIARFGYQRLEQEVLRKELSFDDDGQEIKYQIVGWSVPHAQRCDLTILFPDFSAEIEMSLNWEEIDKEVIERKVEELFRKEVRNKDLLLKQIKQEVGKVHQFPVGF